MSGDGGRPLVTGFVQQSPTSSRNLASHHGPPMNGEHRGEPWTAELPYDVENASLIGRLPDEATQV